MKKIKLLIIFLLLLPLLGCSSNEDKTYKGQTLVIYNVADYISNGEDESVDLISKFEEETGCEVKYYTYDTNETMYNQFKLQKEGTYDLVCTSDYMIQKMVKEGLVQKFDDYQENIPNYDKYGSKVLRDKLKNMVVESPSGITNLDEFSVGYMWGTLGIVYDPYVSDTMREDVKSWDVFYDEQYKDMASIKNSMRDAYVVGLMHHYSKDPEYVELMNQYLNSDDAEIDARYLETIQDIFDFKLDGQESSSIENLEKIENVRTNLIDLKKNIFGFETDSGKNDIVEGSKIKMNLAYSGDAVYSIATAFEESDGKVLEYYVPDDGSNNWYDCWMLPNGANKELAYKFLDFISDPYNASDNMDFIGYTPFVVGDAIFTNVAYWYGAADYCSYSSYYEDALVIYDNALYCCIKDTEEGILPTNEEYFECCEYDNSCQDYEEGDMVSFEGKIYNIDENLELVLNEGYDISYLFSDVLEDGRSSIIYPYDCYVNSLETQYPSEKILSRCAIMNDFAEFNADVIIMWGQVKAYTNMTPTYVFLIVFVVGIIGLSIYSIIKKKNADKYKRGLM